MARKSLSKFTRAPVPMGRKLIQAVQSSDDEDRIAAIVNTALIEQALESAIKSKFIRLRTKDADSLFVGYAPLASFSAKIRVGFALGLFGSQTRHDLEIIKDIRNAFAHNSPLTKSVLDGSRLV